MTIDAPLPPTPVSTLQQHLDWVADELRDHLQLMFGPTGRLVTMTGAEFAERQPEVRGRYQVVSAFPQAVVAVTPVDPTRDPTMYIWMILAKQVRTGLMVYEFELFDDVMSATQAPTPHFVHVHQRLYTMFRIEQLSLDEKDLVTIKAVVLPKIRFRRQHHEQRVDWLDKLATYGNQIRGSNAN